MFALEVSFLRDERTPKWSWIHRCAVVVVRVVNKTDAGREGRALNVAWERAVKRPAPFVRVDEVENAGSPDIQPRGSFRVEALAVLDKSGLWAIAGDLLGPRRFPAFAEGPRGCAPRAI